MSALDPKTPTGAMALERNTIDAIANLLSEMKWAVHVEPRVGDSRPDLVVESPEGEAYVVDLKLGQGTTSFDSLARLAHVLREFEKEGSARPNRRPRPRVLLLTTRRVPSSVQETANELGVELLQVGGDAPLVARSLAAYLLKDEGPGRQEEEAHQRPATKEPGRPGKAVVAAQWCEDLRLPSGTLGGGELNARRAQAVTEALSWPTGTSSSPLRTMLYVRGSYTVGVAKPGKEAERQTESVNPDDMLPIVTRDGEDIAFTPGFTGIFRLLWDLEPRGTSAHALAGLLFHMAYMVSHRVVDGHERLVPPTSVLDEVDAGMPAIIAGSDRTLPPSVFVYLLEALALNEDVKYRNHPSWSDGTGRRNTLLTCVNVIAWRMQGMHPMEAGGRLTRGVAPISQKQALALFPCLTGSA